MPEAEEYLSKVEQKIQFKILNSIQKTETGLSLPGIPSRLEISIKENL